MTLLARAISFLFHPLFVTTYLFLVFRFWFPIGLEPIPIEVSNQFLILVFGITAVLPVVNMIFFRLVGVIKTMEMTSRRERVIPFLFIALMYFGIVLMLLTRPELSMDDNFIRFLSVAASLVSASFLISLFYKASIHALAWGGFVGILLLLARSADSGSLLFPIIGGVVIAGLVMSSRLYLNAHTPREILVGSMTGVATSFTVVELLFS